MSSRSQIRGIVFDLDGTLYVCDRFAGMIQDAAVAYMAGVRGIGINAAQELMAETRRRLNEESGTVQTLSAVCAELGGSIVDLHSYFTAHLHPESHLVRDERVINLLHGLAGQYSLYLFTNNNRALATRIVTHLGLVGLFRDLFAIDDAWLAKPDEQALQRIMSLTGLMPAETLFVGDRYDVDLRIPEQCGCPVYLSQNVEQLLRLADMLAATR